MHTCTHTPTHTQTHTYTQFCGISRANQQTTIVNCTAKQGGKK